MPPVSKSARSGREREAARGRGGVPVVCTDGACKRRRFALQVEALYSLAFVTGIGDCVGRQGPKEKGTCLSNQENEP